MKNKKETLIPERETADTILYRFIYALIIYEKYA